MKKLDALFPKDTGRLSFTQRYTKELRDRYEKDLLYVVKGMKAGKCRPMLKALQEYFLDTYGMTMTEGTLRKHIGTLKAGQKLWDEK